MGSASSKSSAQAVHSLLLTESELERLKGCNTIIIVDDSDSMYGPLWDETRELLRQIVQIAGKHDEHGITIRFLNSDRTLPGAKDGGDVVRFFNTVSPHGPTMIDKALMEVGPEYLNDLKQCRERGVPLPKRLNILILTDGVPTDDPAKAIEFIAKQLDVGGYDLTQLGIQFVQIGNNIKATEYLQRLDDELEKVKKIRDIVDTTPYAGGTLTTDKLIKILLGGIDRRIDGKKET